MQNHSENVLTAADLELNPETKSVKRAGISIYLTALEFQLLEFLLRRKGRVVSKSDIAIHVWNIDLDMNRIDEYVNSLRNKIHIPSEKELIHNRAGRGFVLAEEQI
jgi:two-component system copper resistance phosphate regulon response regulator CusR